MATQLAQFGIVAPRDLAHFLGAPWVTKIFAIREGTTVSVWTMVDDLSREKRDQIYDLERELSNRYRGNIKFDFHIMADSPGVDISGADLVYVR